VWWENVAIGQVVKAWSDGPPMRAGEGRAHSSWSETMVIAECIGGWIPGSSLAW
jgi:hypothetical protein